MAADSTGNLCPCPPTPLCARVRATAEQQTLGRRLRAWSARLARGGRGSREDAERLACHVLQCNRARLYMLMDDPVDAQADAGIDALVEACAAGTPVPYLTGIAGFWTFDLAVTRDTLIPRADTATLVEAALAAVTDTDDGADVLDLGTGTGAVALALAAERRAWRLTATDASAAALEVARDNARRLGLEARIRFLHGDWYGAVPAGETFALIVSNPPYIAARDPHLDDPGLAAEPRTALVAGDDGLAALGAIIAGAPARLRAGGALWVEHGHAQGAAVRRLLEAAGFSSIATRRDAGHRERASGGRLRVS